MSTITPLPEQSCENTIYILIGGKKIKQHRKEDQRNAEQKLKQAASCCNYPQLVLVNG